MRNQTDLSELTEEQVMLFIQCCGKISIYESPKNRVIVLNQLWAELETNKFLFNVQHYNAYIQVYTENRIHMNCDSFLARMKCAPNHVTYKLLLQNVCEKGDLDQVFFLLSLIKGKGYTVDEEIFNCLVLGHTVHT